MNKLCALDIDGVLNYYPDCWVDFVNKKVNTNFKTLDEAKENLSYKQYNELKKEYREGSYKLSLPVREGVAEFTSFLKKNKYDIIIITSRPFEEYPHLRILTHNWLQLNEITYSDLFHSARKHLDILQFYPNLEFMVEDNRFFANKIGNLGYSVFLMNNIYNQGEVDSKVTRINSLDKIQIKLMEELICQKTKI